MKTAKNVQLNVREFGADLVAAPALERWLLARDLPGLKILLPNSEGPAFVQVEHLLCAIEGARLADLTASEARATVPPSALAAFAASFGLCAEELQGIEHWLAGAAVHSAMRDRLRIAFSTGDLQLLDGLTLAPKLTATTQQPAAPQTEGEPDPARRLRVLRELGGSAQWWKGSTWKFKGIAHLVRKEKDEQRERSDEKTIRADLKEAAEAERLSKKDGISARPLTQSTEPAPAGDVGLAESGKHWKLKRVSRYPGYRKPLFDVLRAASVAGQKLPTAREVLDAWRLKRPFAVARTTPDTVDYFDSNGTEKTADLKAIQQAINNLTE